MSGTPLVAQQVEFDQSTLAVEPAMVTLLEKTIFKVDVASLQIWFDAELSATLQTLADTGNTGAQRDTIVALATRATDALARLHFERNVSLNQFLDGLQSSARKACEAAIIRDATYADIVASSPDWYAFLEGRGIHDGDEMFYRIRGDTLRTVFRAADGTILLDRRDVGAERRLAVLGGYLAPGSDFRAGLVKSVAPPNAGAGSRHAGTAAR